MDNLYMVVERQSEIIRIQSEVINGLFSLVLQHISADEADALPCVQKINHAAEIRREIMEA